MPWQSQCAPTLPHSHVLTLSLSKLSLSHCSRGTSWRAPRPLTSRPTSGNEPRQREWREIGEREESGSVGSEWRERGESGERVERERRDWRERGERLATNPQIRLRVTSPTHPQILERTRALDKLSTNAHTLTVVSSRS